MSEPSPWACSLDSAAPAAPPCVALIPGGGENFFRAAGTPAERPELPPPSERNLERFQAAAAGNGVVLLGPPPFDMASIAG
jgi:hypothetical protein